MADGVSALGNLLCRTDATGALVVGIDGSSPALFPLLAPDGTAAAPSYSYATAPTSGFFRAGGGTQFSNNGTARLLFSNSIILQRSAGQISWTDGELTGGTTDLTIARGGAGVMTLSNGAGDFGRLQFGGTTNAFPALRRSGSALLLRSADDASYVTFVTGGLQVVNSQLTLGTATIIQTGTGTPEGVVAAVVGSIFLRTDPASLSTTLYVKTTGAATNTGWSAVTIP